MLNIFEKCLFAILLLAAVNGDAATIASLSDGPPVLLGKNLSPENYVVVKARKLARAKVVWLNLDYLRELGVDLPPEGMTEDVERQILNAFAWQIVHTGDPDWKFTGEERDIYVDRYGGQGMGLNFGSGRAGSLGVVQFKGIGQTPLIGTGESHDHGSGSATLEELIREAIWGEINQRELPFGGNRVLAIIDTGATVTWPSGTQEPQAVGIRFDPLRPAHFMFAEFGEGPLAASEKQRTRESNKFLSAALPVPEEFKSASGPVRVRQGLLEYARRLGRQYGTAYARSLFHGATSPSNFDLRGPFLDYGTETAQPGFGKIKILQDEPAFGDTPSEIKVSLIKEFRENIRKFSAPAVARQLPDVRTMWAGFMKSYNEAIAQGMLELTGLPPETISKLAKTRAAQRLAKTIDDVATFGTHEINIDKQMVSQVSPYDVKKILVALSRLDNLDGVPGQVTESLTHPRLRRRLINDYTAFFSAAEKYAKTQGVDSQSLRTYVREHAAVIDKEITRLYRPYMRDENRWLIDNYRQDGDRSKIWRSINERITLQTRTYKTLPFETVISEDVNLDDGTVTRRLYNAQRNQHELEIRTRLNPHGSFFLLGKEIPADPVTPMVARWSADKWATSNEVNLERKSNELVIRLKLPRRDSEIDVDPAMIRPARETKTYRTSLRTMKCNSLLNAVNP